MTYSVVWKLTAIQQLGQLVAAATEPDRVRKAAAFVDYLLRRIPNDVGESRAGTHRVWYEDVLGVYYAVDDTAMTASVLLVGFSRRN